MHDTGHGRLPMPESATPWAGRTKGRHVASAAIDSSAEIERLVDRAVGRAQEGDREALRFLYLRYADNVYSYVRTIVRDHHDAEDVTQQVFTKLLTAIGRYESRGVPFVAWLLRLSHNVAIDAMRARRAIPAPEIYGAEHPEGADGTELSRTLREALEELPLDQREVVVLRHILGLTPVEIAERLGRTDSSVYGLHHRGRRALCAELTRRDAVPVTGDHLRAGLAA